MTVTAIIPAAGYGRRMKDNLPKQFLMLGSRPILFQTLRNVARCSKIHDMVVAVPETHYEYAKVLYEEEYKLDKPVHFVTGGAERQESVRCALQALSLECDLVVIHDGVRPFVSAELLAAVIAAAQKSGAASAAIRPRDTVKLMEPGHKAQNLPRDQVYLIQTPQAFDAGLIREAHEKALHDGFSGTDDTVLVERLGYQVAIVEGHYLNIKITTPDGLVVGKAILEHFGE